MFITEVWENQPGAFFCISTKSRAGQWRDRFFKRKDLHQVVGYIEDNLDKDVYWCPHGFTRPRRLKSYAKLPSLLWADLDEASPVGMVPQPTIAWESSPGRYVALWETETQVDELLNRRLTYHVGADPGGWDVTQVLRVPGTRNYKYPHTPVVKLLWKDGPVYSIPEIENVLPKEVVGEATFGEAKKIYDRYENHMTHFCRREILKGKPKQGKRSEVLWRLAKELLETGMTRDEAFVVLSGSPWNKFRGRRDGSKQLRRELDKALDGKLEAQPVEIKEEREEGKFLVHSMAEVEEIRLNWLWYPYLARSEMTILEGDPGLGKSYLAQMVGLSLVDGKRLPCIKTGQPKCRGRVVYFDLENSAGTVTKRRLVDNGCANFNNYFQEERPFRIDDEDALELVYDGLERVKPDLVVFDTINTYIGKADTHKASETQQALAQFMEIAKRFNCSVLVVRHLTKSTKDKAIYRGQGSIAFAGMARVIITVGQHPDEEDTRVMAVTKLNVTRRPPALTFTIEALPDTLKYQDRSRFRWGDFVDLSSEEIVTVKVKTDKEKSNKREAIKEFLLDMLSDGPARLSAIERAAQARGYAIKTVKLVAEEIGVATFETKNAGSRKVQHWKLPSEPLD